MSQDWLGIQQGNSKYKADIIKVGLEHSLATQYTSFVAVETRTVVKDGKPVRVEVPVELPESVSPLAAQNRQFDRLQSFSKLSTVGGGIGSGSGGGIGSGHAAGIGGTYATAANQTIELADTVRSAPVGGPVTRVPGGGSANGKLGSIPPASPSTRDERKQLASKLQPELLHIYNCATQQKLDSAGGTCKAIPWRVRVSIDLSSTGAAVQQKLAKLGFRTQRGVGTTHVVGSIPAKQLRSLALMDEVQSVSLVK